MSKEISIDRKKFLGAAAGGAAVAAASGPWVARAFSSSAGKGKPVVPPGSVGIQQFSIRDSITRLGVNIYDKDGNVVATNPTPTMGFLGGPNYPADPTDLGPSVPLPGGFLETFQYLKSVGYDGIEFFSFTQNAASLRDPAAVTPTNPNGQRQPTIAEIRVLLDKAGLKAVGTHTGSLNSMYDATTGGLSANGLTQISNAQILGYSMIGQAGDPTNVTTLADRVNPNGTITIGWTEVARRSNVVGGLLAAQGIKYFYHPEQNWFQFFDPVVHPELTDVNRLEWFTENTDSDQGVLRARHPPLVLGGRPLPEVGRLALRPVQVGARGRQAVHRLPPQGRRPEPRLGRAARGWALHPEQAARRHGDDRRDRVGRGRDRPGPSGRREVAGVGRLRQVGPEAGRALRAPAPDRERRRRRRGRRSGAVAAACLDQRRHHDRAEAVGLRSQNERGRHGPWRPRALIAAALAALATAAAAHAHADPTIHYLETQNLVASVGLPATQSLELQLLGLVQAIDRRGYPIKVSVIANETDTGGESEPLADPQEYAELVVRELELFFEVEAPVLIVTPNGFGVAGKHVRAGRLAALPRRRRPVAPPRDRGAAAGSRRACPDGDARGPPAGRRRGPAPAGARARREGARASAPGGKRERRGRRHLGLVARSRQHPAAGLGALRALGQQISGVRSPR